MEPAILTPPLPRCPAAESDWPAFIDGYGRWMLEWFRRRAGSRELAETITADLLASIAPAYTQRGEASGFRPWLRAAADQAWRRRFADRAPPEDLTAAELLESREEYLQALDDECTRQRRSMALARVASIAEPADWETFWLVVVDGASMEDAAALRPGGEWAVRAALHRVRRLLDEELILIDEQC